MSRTGGQSPRWGLRQGDLLGFARGDGREVRVAVADVQAPDREHPYLRLTVVVVDAAGWPLDVDLRRGDHDSQVPVGDAAHPLNLHEAVHHALSHIRTGTDLITPGLAVIVPAEPSNDEEARQAGFFTLDEQRQVTAHGEAILLTWAELADRLEHARF